MDAAWKHFCASLSTKLSTVHVNGWVGHNRFNLTIGSIGFVIHHTSGGLADLALAGVLYCRPGAGH